MKHQIYCLNLKSGMSEMIWKIENGHFFSLKKKKDTQKEIEF